MDLISRLLGRLKQRSRFDGGYTGRIPYRGEANDSVSGGEGVQLFSSDRYQAINKARMEHLLSLGLPIDGKRVIDVGCGTGDLAEVFLERGCEVACVDGREENIAAVKKRFGNLTACVADIDREDIEHLGMFDIVFCYGLLYHLENPMGGLRRLAAVCREMLLMETMICDHAHPAAVFMDEPATNTQAMRGLGCRPSPSLVALGLNRAGMDHVYLVRTHPNHPHFHYKWKNNLDTFRGSQHLRAVFVASRKPMSSPLLLPLLREAPP